MAIFPGSAIPSAVSSYGIDNSCRFYGGSLARTPSSQGSLQKLTMSVWVKAGVLGGAGSIWSTTIGGDGEGALIILAAGEFGFYWYDYGEPEGSRYIIYTKSDMLLRDPSAWYHIVVGMDTTQSVESNRVKMYLNGEQVTVQASPYLANTPYPPINYSTGFNKTNSHVLGGFKGNMSDCYYIDGTEYDADDFGELNSSTNQWVPLDSDDIKDAVTFGTNGFFLDFSSAGSITDITTEGYAIKSSEQSSDGQIATNAFDGSTGNVKADRWRNNESEDNSLTDTTYIGQDFGSGNEKHIRSIRLFQGRASGTGECVPSLKVQYSDDNSSWTDVESFTGLGALNYFINLPLPATGDHRYWRILATANSSSGAWLVTELEMSLTGSFGIDSSGNRNDLTPTDLVASDQLIDTPTNNFATFNPLFATGQATPSTYKEGNLEVVSPSGTDLNGMTEGTIGIPSSGKWYWEHYTDNANYQLCGIASADFLTGTASNVYMGFGESRGYMNSSGNKVGSGVYTAYGDTWTTGDIIGVAVDMDNGAIYFAKNNTWQDSGDPTSGASKTGAAYTDLLTSSDFDSGILPGWSDQNGGTTDTTIGNFGQDSSFAGNKTAQGNGGAGEDFFYTPPTGFKALNTDNLSAPEIALPGENFNTLIWTGNGATRSMTGVGFQPDLTWVKQRDGSEAHQLMDSARGADKYIQSNVNEAQGTSGFTSFDSDGWTMTSNTAVNQDTKTYVGWSWEAGGAPTVDNSAAAGATPTAGSVKIDGSNLGSALAGSIAATRISANTETGFSIVTYEGTGNSGTDVAHCLSEAPNMIIIKNLTTSAWVVGSTLLTNWGWKLVLNTNAATVYHPEAFYGAAPSATFFRLGDADETNESGENFVAYCFHSVEGYSKVGSYDGNGNVDGSFIYTGFRPAFFLLKDIDGTGNWILYDNKRNGINETKQRLFPDEPDAEATGASGIDFVSNGFKYRSTSADMNGNGTTYVYLAIAESPFKYSNAR